MTSVLAEKRPASSEVAGASLEPGETTMGRQPFGGNGPSRWEQARATVEERRGRLLDRSLPSQRQHGDFRAELQMRRLESTAAVHASVQQALHGCTSASSQGLEGGELPTQAGGYLARSRTRSMVDDRGGREAADAWNDPLADMPDSLHVRWRNLAGARVDAAIERARRRALLELGGGTQVRSNASLFHRFHRPV
mgnify:CR=1 FL=1